MIQLSSPTYDKLRFLAQVLLPILGTLYFALAGIWDLPSADTVVGTIIAVVAFLGVLLHLSNASFQHDADGVIEVFQSATGKKTYSLNLNGDPEDIDTRDEVVFKVNKPQGPDYNTPVSPISKLPHRR